MARRQKSEPNGNIITDKLKEKRREERFGVYKDENLEIVILATTKKKNPIEHLIQP